MEHANRIRIIASQMKALSKEFSKHLDEPVNPNWEYLKRKTEFIKEDGGEFFWLTDLRDLNVLYSFGIKDYLGYKDVNTIFPDEASFTPNISDEHFNPTYPYLTSIHESHLMLLLSLMTSINHVIQHEDNYRLEPLKHSATAYYAMKMKEGDYRYVQQTGKVFCFDRNNKPVLNLVSCRPIHFYNGKIHEGVFVEIRDGKRKNMVLYEEKTRSKAKDFLIPVFKKRHYPILDTWFEERLSREINSTFLAEKLFKSESTIKGYRKEILKDARKHFKRGFRDMEELILFLEGSFWSNRRH